MFADLISLEQLTPEALDTYLAHGWFRMRQTIFTTHFLHFKGRFYSAIWLRINLGKLLEEKKFRELKKRNEAFNLEIKPVVLDRRHEMLFAAYKASIDFDTSDNIRQLLHGYDSHNHFNTYEINLYDQNRLIASGYFDVGVQSAAGIASFYDPAYKKYSLGKYLIYCKVAYCQQVGLQYFYPGYTAPGYGMFDYKLQIGHSAMEFYCLAKQQWLPHKQDSFTETPLQAMHRHLTLLQQLLQQQKRTGRVLYYRYFDACLDPFFTNQPLLDYPVFLSHRYLTDLMQYQIIVYNISIGMYEMLQCSSIYQMENFEGGHHIFSSDLLQVESVVVKAGTAGEMMMYLL